jgi:RNA ligase (TIGR02306 family)
LGFVQKNTLDLCYNDEGGNMNTIATIGKVTSIQPIDGADFIVLAQVVCGKFGKWSGAVQKGQLSEGDLCEVYLQDCIVPNTERFSFMEKHKFIVKMARFKKVPSECLIMPLTIEGEIGDDIASKIGCEKHNKPLPANMSGDALGNFPSFIPKTDEPNFQSVPQLVSVLVGQPYYITEKEDGSSATCYKYEGHFGCCSRNLEMKDTPTNAIWQIARKYDLENKLTEGMAIQFECVGPGIQGNPMGLKQVEPRLFNLYSISERKYLDELELNLMAQYLSMPMVAFVESGSSFPAMTDEELRVKAEGVYPNGKQREGIVIRSLKEMNVAGDRTSFKIVNLRYKS